MKKLQLFTVLALLGSVFSCTPKTSIKGEIKGLGNDTIFVKTVKIDEFYSGNSKIDTIVAKNDKFEYSPKIEELCMVFLSPKKLKPHHLNVFLDKDENVKITGKVGEYNMIEHTMTGSELNEINSKFTNTLTEENKEIFLLNEKIKNVSNEEEKQALYAKRRGIIKKIRDKQIEYVKANPNNQFSGFLVGRYLFFEEFEKCYALLNPAVQKGKFATILSQKKAIGAAIEKLFEGNQSLSIQPNTLDEEEVYENLDELVEETN